MNNHHQDFYEKLRASTEEWMKEHNMENGADYILLAPDFFYLLCKLVIDKDVELNEKLKLCFALTYFISPLDIFPEAFVGTIGLVDDVALAAYVLSSILSVTPAKIVKRYWLGKNDVLDEIEGVLKKVDTVIGGGLWHKIMTFLDSSADKKDHESKTKEDKPVEKSKAKEKRKNNTAKKKSTTKKPVVKKKTTAKKKESKK
ncbi:MAG: DUF1232 domain-containing protein [Alphaproteobacteria bacterium]|nr:DUF1232 domain-containing protein [Alphaproteobacteria bacterium]